MPSETTPTHLANHDAEVSALVEREVARQRTGLEMIASENYPSRAVLEAVGSILSAKYAEGYPGKRYYGGNEIIDDVERLAIARAKKVFGAAHVNVQPYSGSPANLAVYMALLKPGDTILGMSLAAGGHLTHGHKVSASGIFFNAVQYGVDEKTGLIDYNQVQKLAEQSRPKLLVSGTTAYPRLVDFERMQGIAKSVGALHMADVSHTAGLIAAGVVPNPVAFCDVVMMTTHKTLRGPRGAMIFCRPDLAKAIDRAVFPGLQGGPHENTIAGIAVALKEAGEIEFADYARHTIENAKALAGHLVEDFGFHLVTGGTDTHLILVDLRNKGVTGQQAETALGAAGITVNKNTVPGETRSPFDPSGIRIGTPAITSRGVRRKDTQKIAGWIAAAIKSHEDEKQLATIKQEVTNFASELPLPGVDI